jgi:arginine utilization protein RocB
MSIETITALQIYNFDFNALPPLYIISINFAFFLLGLICHTIKKQKEYNITTEQYWLNDEQYSHRSIYALIISFITLNLTCTNAPVLLYFTTSYLCDSMLNKASATDDSMLNKASTIDDSLHIEQVSPNIEIYDKL